MALSARITLEGNGPLSFHGNGRALKRGEGFVTSNESEILYFKRQQGVSVKMIEGRLPKVGAIKTVTLPAVPPEPATGRYTEGELNKLTKNGLLELIEGEGYTKPEPTATKAELVALVMASQAASKDETEDEDEEDGEGEEASDDEDE